MGDERANLLGLRELELEFFCPILSVLQNPFQLLNAIVVLNSFFQFLGFALIAIRLRLEVIQAPVGQLQFTFLRGTR